MSYTKGKLQLSSSTMLISEDGKVIANTFSMVGMRDLAPDILTSEANARRFALCWNACEGMTNDEVEAPSRRDFQNLLEQEKVLLEMRETQLSEALTDRNKAESQLDQRTEDYDRALELAEAIGKDRDRERAEKKEILLTFKREYKLLLETFKYAKRMLRNIEEDVDMVYVDTTMQRANQQLEAIAKAEGKE